MKLRQLEYFVAVAETGSIRRAAESLYVAQPSLSSQLAMLETELGGQLFVRKSRGVELTPAGRVFLAEAHRILGATEHAMRSTRRVLQGDAGEIRFATVLSIAAGLMPGALSRWRLYRPEVRASLEEYRRSDDLERAAADGHHDLAIGPSPTQSFEFLEKLGVEEFVVVLPAEDPLLGESSVDIGDLSDRAWVYFHRSHGLSVVVDGILADKRMTPSASVVTSQTDVAVNLAIAGLGPTIVPRNVVPQPLRHQARPLRPQFVRELYAYAPRAIPPQAADLIRELRAELGSSATV